MESENWSDMDMDDMEEGGNMAPAYTTTVKWSIVEYNEYLNIFKILKKYNQII